MNCPKCGTMNNKGFKFCIKCGHNLEGNPIVSENTPIATTTSNEISPRQQEVTLQSNSQSIQSQPQSQAQNPNITNIPNPVNTENSPLNFNNMQYGPMTGHPTNQQPQQSAEQTTNTYQQPVPPQPKKKIDTKLLIIIATSLVVVVIAGIIFIPKLFDNKGKNDILESLTDSTSFWIENDDHLYAMFDINGKQLTGFDFTDVSSKFINGTAKVVNKNGEYGLISKAGKMIIEFGKYDYIFGNYAVYEMTDKEYNRYLYNNSGKLVRQLKEDEEVESYIGEYTYALIKSYSDYKVIDYTGREITSIPIPEDDDADDPIATSKGNYVSIFYNKVSYIIDISKGKTLLTIPDSRRFCIGDVNEENPNEFILSTCTTYYGEERRDSFKLIRNGKVAYSIEPTKYASMKFEGNNVVYQEDDTYLLDENGNKKTKVNLYTIYKDYNNYIKEVDMDKISHSAELYVKGSLKEKIDCNNVQGGYARHGVYLLEHCSGFGNGDKIYMNYDGTRINDKSYKRAYEFDENGYAPVSEDAKNFYLINLKGEKVSDYYTNNSSAEKIYNVAGTDNLYRGTNEDGTTTVFEVGGKKLLTGKFIWPMTDITADGNFVIVEKDNKYTVYDLIKAKDIVTLGSEPTMFSNYFTTSENSKTQYYSYTTGKLFYEE